MDQNTDQLGSAIEAFKAVVGQPHVLSDDASLSRYALSTGPAGTRPAAVVRPEASEQVQRIVRIAGQYRVRLYPISRGYNFGYGDACAPTDGQVIVDLGRMDRIIEVNRELHYCVIGPGVKQGQLADYLAKNAPELVLDCTGAGRDASLVGNTLDRGFGHTPYGDHFLHTCGMKVVLADGTELNTGFGAFDGARSGRVYRYGVGPFLDGIFCQSNFGIVTEIGLWLMPRPEAFSAFFFSVDDEAQLEAIIDRLAPLRRSGLLRSAIHIANDLRVVSSKTQYPWDRAGGATPLPDALRKQLRREHGVGLWMGAGSIEGSRGLVKQIKRELKRALKPVRITFMDERRYALAQRLVGLLNRFGLARGLTGQLRALRPVLDLMQGTPTDEPLAGVRWRLRGNLDEAQLDPRLCGAGLMWASPVLPMTGHDARRVMQTIEPIFAAHGFECPITFTMINERAMIGITNVFFDRRDEDETARAAACYDQLVQSLIDAGYPPYRTGPGGFAKLHAPAEAFWRVAGRLKHALDPEQILSPGRYLP